MNLAFQMRKEMVRMVCSRSRPLSQAEQSLVPSDAVSFHYLRLLLSGLCLPRPRVLDSGPDSGTAPQREVRDGQASSEPGLWL